MKPHGIPVERRRDLSGNPVAAMRPQSRPPRIGRAAWGAVRPESKRPRLQPRSGEVRRPAAGAASCAAAAERQPASSPQRSRWRPAIASSGG